MGCRIYNETGSAIELVDENNNGLYRLNARNAGFRDNNEVVATNAGSRNIKLWENTRNSANNNRGDMIVGGDVQLNLTTTRPEVSNNGIIRIGLG